ncbi:MAG: protein kinase [bacterium]|nr:protein kinase [bacterium]
MSDYQPGDVLDDFKITKVLFSGASASLYEALDGLSGETVVLKVPFGDILNRPFLYYHYQNEERITRTLKHPRLARYIIRDRSLPYMIMEHIPGRDLKSILYREKKLHWDRARRIILQVCEGLIYLHNRGIIHHDIKPENMIMGSGDAVKLIDFGLASKTGFQDLIALDLKGPHGTPYYISPEELQGIRDEPRSDLYSLGVVLYEMVTANLPFQRSTRLSKVKARLKIDPVPPRYYDETISPGAQEIILKALERSPEARYATAAALKEDLLHVESLPLTPRSYTTKKPFLWSLRSGSTKVPEPRGRQETRRHSVAPGLPVQIIGTIVDHDVSDLVIETMRRKALLMEGAVTLITLWEEDGDSEITRYQTAVEGERFSERIERYVSRLRRYNIDPTVRIVKGTGAEGIVAIARELGAVLIVVGPSRKIGWQKLFGGHIADQVMRKAPCSVVVAESTPSAAMPAFKDVSDLTPDALIEMDLFLIEMWVQHVNWLSQLALMLLGDPRSFVDLDERKCPIGTWLGSMKATGIWPDIDEIVGGAHSVFHAVANEMVSRVESGDMEGMRRLYMEEAMPLSCEVKESLKRVSTYLREQTVFKEAGLIPFLQDDRCPFSEEGDATGGPMLKVIAIRRYFREHPEGSPRSCLSEIQEDGRDGT